MLPHLKQALRDMITMIFFCVYQVRLCEYMCSHGVVDCCEEARFVEVLRRRKEVDECANLAGWWTEAEIPFSF
jgi:hypothetical protein